MLAITFEIAAFLFTHVTQTVTAKSHRDDQQLASGFNPMNPMFKNNV